MINFPVKKAALYLFFAFLFLAPLGANAQTTSGIASWFISHLSNLFEARKDTVESNSLERNQLLLWRRGIVSIDTSSSSNVEASTSPVFISKDIFEEKRSAIVVELLTAENSLKTSESELADFIDNSTASGKGMNVADTILAEADVDIDNADQAISTFTNYNPSVASSSDPIDLQAPQAYLEAAITAIQTAKASLQYAIDIAGSSI